MIVTGGRHARASFRRSVHIVVNCLTSAVIMIFDYARSVHCRLIATRGVPICGIVSLLPAILLETGYLLKILFLQTCLALAIPAFLEICALRVLASLYSCELSIAMADHEIVGHIVPKFERTTLTR